MSRVEWRKSDFQVNIKNKRTRKSKFGTTKPTDKRTRYQLLVGRGPVRLPQITLGEASCSRSMDKKPISMGDLLLRTFVSSFIGKCLKWLLLEETDVLSWLPPPRKEVRPTAANKAATPTAKYLFLFEEGPVRLSWPWLTRRANSSSSFSCLTVMDP